MVCRDTAVTCALLAWTRRTAGMLSADVQDTFHRLREQAPEDTDQPDPVETAAFLNGLLRAARTQGEVSAVLIASFADRVDRAELAGYSPGPATWHAMTRLQGAVEARKASLDRVTVQAAACVGDDPVSTAKDVRRWRSAAYRNPDLLTGWDPDCECRASEGDPETEFALRMVHAAVPVRSGKAAARSRPQEPSEGENVRWTTPVLFGGESGTGTVVRVRPPDRMSASVGLELDVRTGDDGPLVTIRTGWVVPEG